MEFRKDNMSEYCKNCYELQQQLDQLKAENKHINDLLNQALKELEKTIETLTEIKEIAKKAGNTQYLTFPDFNLQQNAKMLMGQFNGYLQQILQKISECEV